MSHSNILLLCGFAAPAMQTEPSTVPKTTEVPTTQPTTVPTEPQPERFLLTFAGNCTLGDDRYYYGYRSGFLDTIGEDYSYPFRNVADYFWFDDFTMVNLEGVFCDTGIPMDPDDLFVFHGSESYINILTEGSVEAVNLANNHTLDYGYRGWKRPRNCWMAPGLPMWKRIPPHWLRLSPA